MDRKEAITCIEKYLCRTIGTVSYQDLAKALDMAIEALQFIEHFDSLKEYQSLQEVVRCKDCKHHEAREWYNICDIHVGNGYPDNWFCADGERGE